MQVSSFIEASTRREESDTCKAWKKKTVTVGRTRTHGLYALLKRPRKLSLLSVEGCQGLSEQVRQRDTGERPLFLDLASLQRRSPLCFEGFCEQFTLALFAEQSAKGGPNPGLHFAKVRSSVLAIDVAQDHLPLYQAE